MLRNNAGAMRQLKSRPAKLSMNAQRKVAGRALLKTMTALLMIVIVAVLGFAALLFFQQHAMIYHPRPYPAGYERLLPREIAVLRYTTAAGKQVAFYVPPRSGEALPVRIWVAFPGNASVALDWLDLATRDATSADGFLLIDYPGYGESEGHASIASTRESADIAFATLAEHLRVPQAELAPRLCVIGLSLGAAAALEFAAGHPIQRAVLIAPFTSLRDMAAQLFARPFAYLLRENYDNRARLAELATRDPAPRVAIFHGTMDTLILPGMGRDLAESAPAITEYFPVEGATHDTVFGAALDSIVAWMKR